MEEERSGISENLEKIQRDLQDSNAETRLAAIESLSQNPNAPHGLPFLFEALGDSEWRVRKATISAFLKLECDAQIVEKLIEFLACGDDAARRNTAIEVLMQLGECALPFILPKLAHPNREIRKFIADILGEIKNRRAVPELMMSLADPDENVQIAAAEALGRIRDPHAVESLIQLLRREDTLIQYAALKALQQIKDSRAVEPIIGLLGKQLLERAALEALSRLGDFRALNPILHALCQGSKKRRDAASVALVELCNRFSQDQKTRCICRVREVYGKDLSIYLISALEDDNVQIKLASIRILGWMGETKAIKGLIKCFDDQTQDEIITALVSMKGEAIEPLLAEPRYLAKSATTRQSDH